MRCGEDNRIRSRSEARLRRHAPETGASDDSRSSVLTWSKRAKHAFESVLRNKKNDPRSFLLVEIIGFEPMTPCLQGRCSSQLSHTPKFDALLYYQTKAMLSIKFAKFFYYIIVLLKLKTFVQIKKDADASFFI